MKEICRDCYYRETETGGCALTLFEQDDATCIRALSRRVEGLERSIQRMTEEARETKAPTPDLRPGLRRAREFLAGRADARAFAAADRLVPLETVDDAATLLKAITLAARRDELRYAMDDIEREMESDAASCRSDAAQGEKP